MIYFLTESKNLNFVEHVKISQCLIQGKQQPSDFTVARDAVNKIAADNFFFTRNITYFHHK